jgi:hypothetical protein
MGHRHIGVGAGFLAVDGDDGLGCAALRRADESIVLRLVSRPQYALPWSL